MMIVTRFNRSFRCAIKNKALYIGMASVSDSAVKPLIRISDVLNMKKSSSFIIPERSSVDTAITHLCGENISSSLVVDDKGEISGLFTARDILRFLHTRSIGRPNGKLEALEHPVRDLMITKERLIFCSPSDTVRRCREIMCQLQIENMPVIENGEALGVVTLKELADTSFTMTEIGGKKGFIGNVSGRKGLPSGTGFRQELSTAENRPKLSVSVGSYALPHPFKNEHGVGANRRHYGANELQTDNQFCEGTVPYS